ncbi:pectinesterase 2-like [Rutidosis leptorrhynchoides]|uniref:pectinesterase 2-like n=1 Tax=Rutidosis leptorrhynchoides TaxID=125765 RepID=UPI003A99A085
MEGLDCVLLKTASISVLVNGSPTREFKIGRGVRQEDPLSPFLFIIAAEGFEIDGLGVQFSKSFKRVVVDGNNTCFWNDVWLGEKPLKEVFKRLVRLDSNTNANVADRLRWNGSSYITNRHWTRDFSGRTVGELNDLEQLIEYATSLDHKKDDSWLWKLCGSVHMVGESTLQCSVFGAKVWQAMVWTFFYLIWKNWNQKVFNNSFWSPPVALNDIQVKSYEWVAKRCKRKKIEWLDWLQNPSIFRKPPNDNHIVFLLTRKTPRTTTQHPRCQIAKMNLILILVLYVLVVFSSVSTSFQEEEETGSDINYWCETTPHPQQCKYFLSRGTHHTPRHRKDFRMLLLQVALEKALDAQTCNTGLRSKCKSKRQKAVWVDCNNLVKNTILQLNETLNGLKHNRCSDFDAQTWLSAALTNLETCFSGSQDFNLTNFVSPLKSHNLTEMISNSLAINQYFVKQKLMNQDLDDDFPSWVTPNDRKLLQSNSIHMKANIVVSQARGSRFRTIQSALNFAAGLKRGNKRYIVYIRKGVYRENLEIGNNLNNIMLLGDGARYTIITGSRSVARGFTTYSTATIGVDGIGFIARGITIRNTAGPENKQAVALRTSSDLSVYYGCSIEGYQDTLFVLAQRQFYKTCYIYGTIDFIFGNAAVVFQTCMILARRPLKGQSNTITAQGRGDPFQNTGISFHNSRVMPAPDLRPVMHTVRTYLGRPWQEYSRTVYMKTFMDSHIDRQGWASWDNSNFAQKTLVYGEYACFGPGSSTRNRVKWPGYQVIRSASVASQYTVERLIAGRSWLPATGIPFIPGL